MEQDQSWAKILSYKYMQGIPKEEIPRFPLVGKGSLIWCTLKKGAAQIKVYFGSIRGGKRHFFGWILGMATRLLFNNFLI